MERVIIFWSWEIVLQISKFQFRFTLMIFYLGYNGGVIKSTLWSKIHYTNLLKFNVLLEILTSYGRAAFLLPRCIQLPWDSCECVTCWSGVLTYSKWNSLFLMFVESLLHIYCLMMELLKLSKFSIVFTSALCNHLMKTFACLVFLAFTLKTVRALDNDKTNAASGLMTDFSNPHVSVKDQN